VKITRDEVLHVASLARLTLSEEEVETYVRQLDAILVYMDQLAQLDTTNIEPMAHVIPLETPFREDRVAPIGARGSSRFRRLSDPRDACS
jgi:aspartyl-tRNA(Asn)/glutamyl-tRNA(Gln) amidotransferase subunit C